MSSVVWWASTWRSPVAGNLQVHQANGGRTVRACGRGTRPPSRPPIGPSRRCRGAGECRSRGSSGRSRRFAARPRLNAPGTMFRASYQLGPGPCDINRRVEPPRRQGHGEEEEIKKRIRIYRFDFPLFSSSLATLGVLAVQPLRFNSFLPSSPQVAPGQRADERRGDDLEDEVDRAESGRSREQDEPAPSSSGRFLGSESDRGHRQRQAHQEGPAGEPVRCPIGRALARSPRPGRRRPRPGRAARGRPGSRPAGSRPRAGRRTGNRQARAQGRQERQAEPSTRNEQDNQGPGDQRSALGT